MQSESEFEKTAVTRILLLPRTFGLPKLEHGSIRGIPDRLFCVNGIFCALEFKKNKKEAMANTGRIVLQKKTINEIRSAGGYAVIVCPENWGDVFFDLQIIAQAEEELSGNA